MLHIMKTLIFIIMTSVPLLSCHADDKDKPSSTASNEYVAGTHYEVLDSPLHT